MHAFIIFLAVIGAIALVAILGFAALCLLGHLLEPYFDPS